MKPNKLGLIIIFLILRNVGDFNEIFPLTLFFFSECCEKVELSSTLYTKETFKTLGVYDLKPIDVVENHNVYKHATSNRHLAFSTDYGWTVNTVTDLT